MFKILYYSRCKCKAIWNLEHSLLCVILIATLDYVKKCIVLQGYFFFHLLTFSMKKYYNNF